MPKAKSNAKSKVPTSPQAEDQKPLVEEGRPNEFKEEYIAKVDEYLETMTDKEVIGRINDKSIGVKLKVKLPTIEGFALFIGVSKKSLYNWEAENPEFLHALDKIRTEQQQRLIDNGLSGDYNSTIAKLMLSSNHGMRERSDVTTNDNSLTPTPEEIAMANLALQQIDEPDSIENIESRDSEAG